MGDLTRRDVLRQAGGVVAASMVPVDLLALAAAAAPASAISPIMATLSSYMAEAGNRALPDSVVEKTKHI